MSPFIPRPSLLRENCGKSIQRGIHCANHGANAVEFRQHGGEPPIKFKIFAAAD
jgi:hypothetical protein